MLPKEKRLVSSSEILDAMKTRHQIRTKFYHIRIKDREDSFGFIAIISKKISKKANKRNLLKRRSHAIVSEMSYKNELPKGISIVAQVYQKSALEAEYSDLKYDLLDGLEKLYFKYIKNQNFTISSQHKTLRSTTNSSIR